MFLAVSYIAARWLKARNSTSVLPLSRTPMWSDIALRTTGRKKRRRKGKKEEATYLKQVLSGWRAKMLMMSPFLYFVQSITDVPSRSHNFRGRCCSMSFLVEGLRQTKSRVISNPVRDSLNLILLTFIDTEVKLASATASSNKGRFKIAVHTQSEVTLLTQAQKEALPRSGDSFCNRQFK